MLQCFHCGGALSEPPPGGRIGRRDTCPRCHRDLHACVQCVNWDAGGRVCHEPSAEQPRDRETANFCDWFRPGARGRAAREADAAAKARAAADALFKRSP